MKQIIAFITVFLFSVSLLAQDKQIFQAKEFFKSKAEHLKITPADVDQARISDAYYDKLNKAHFIYLQQTHDGVDIFNAVTAVAVADNGEVINSGSAFIPEIEKKKIISGDQYNAMAALHQVLRDQRVPIPKKAMKFQKKRENYFEMPISHIAHHPIIAEKVYFPQGDQLVLSWRIEYDSKFTGEVSSVFVNTSNGEIIKEISHTLKCFDASHNHKTAPSESEELIKKSISQKTEAPVSHNKKGDGAQYFVYPYYLESPHKGAQELVVDPSDEVASPYGWHDLDGVEGAEFTITRGNNAHAYLDKDGENQSSGDEPDGGVDLIFDTPHQPDKSVLDPQNEKVDVTQLFYTSNAVHDWIYHLGFDEAAGNYQANNYGKGGRSGDAVQLNSLDAIAAGQLNNANFSVTSDGRAGRMQMFNFESSSPDVSIESPAEIADVIFSGSTNRFGVGRVREELSGRLILTNDGAGDVTDACENITNGDEVKDNIALIRRGTCFFSSKIYNAQLNGAKAAIICNNQPRGIVNMAGADNADDVNIPAYFIRQEDCADVEKAIKDGEEVTVKFIPVTVDSFSSGFDNGIIIHEYGHGISSRLTGGASRSGCLTNDEEMGEGWSDFFALALTTRDGERGSDSRPIGTYVRGDKSGALGGIRRQPYSTDPMLNNQTMNDIRATPSPHGLGEVWAATLWDIYWVYVDLYGFDADWKNTESGNNKAVRLVLGGLKLQPCGPGFIEGRDALLAADRMMFDGQHQCLLWDVFSKRGIGTDAFGGSRQDRNDNKEGFTNLPECIKTAKIEQRQIPMADENSIVEVSVIVRNDTEEGLSNAIATSSIPPNAQYMSSSSTSYSPTLSGDKLSFTVGDLDAGENVELKYRMRVGVAKSTERGLFDDFGPGNGFFETQDSITGRGVWKQTTIVKNLGKASFNVINDTMARTEILTQSIPATLDQEFPAFRFWHRYITENAFDGGVVEISQDNGETWSYVPSSAFLSHPYTVEMIGNIFNDPEEDDVSIDGFTGNSDGWVQSIIDLRDYVGSNAVGSSSSVLMRFKWASDGGTGVSGVFSGWFIDYVDYLDLGTALGEACLTADGIDETCDSAITLLNVKEGSTPNNNIIKSDYGISLFPNPVDEMARVGFELEKRSEIRLSILDLNGRVISSVSEDFNAGQNFKRLQTTDLPEGAYIFQMVLEGQVYNEKFIKVTEE